MTSAIPRLTMSAVRKRYGATIALDDVSLIVAPGEVHAIIGENGAGKSTLMKILAGVVRADQGVIRIDGLEFLPRDPIDARRAGIAMIHQELCLAPHLSVEANLALGIEDHFAGGPLKMREIRRRARAALRRLDRDDIDPGALVRDLSPGARQMVEIARGLMTDSRIMVMDEPTSSLGLHDIERLFAVIATLKSQGVSVIYISHFLEEVASVADRFTVLRDGKVAASGAMRDATTDQLVEQMIGRKLTEMYPRVPREIRRDAPKRLEAREVHGPTLPRGASLDVRAGEIVGVAGLVGAGRTEMLRAIFGLDAMPRGEVVVRNGAVRRSPFAMLRAGVGMLSEDRAREGLALNMAIAHNITLGGLRKVASKASVIDQRRERDIAAELAAKLQTKMRHPLQRVGELSGGNQQKVALARLLYRDVEVLLLDEPTRGIDVASRAQIYALIGELAAKGKSIVFVSSAVGELLGVCDRVVVMHRGAIVAERDAADWTEHEVIQAAIVGRNSPAARGGASDAA